MNRDEYIILALIAVNLAAGFGCAVPIAGELRKITSKPNRFFRYFVLLLIIYFIECVAFAAGMCTQVFSIGLAFVWGLIFGLWLRGRAPARRVLKLAFYVSIYGSLPTASFCILIPLWKFISGGHILSTKEGIGFGIPDFLPWPFDSILGFFASVLAGTILFKTVITTGVVSSLIHFKENSITDSAG